MKTFYRFVGHRGNTTIPFDLRMALDIHPNDLISYTRDGDNIVIRKEHVCNDCKSHDEKGDYLDTKELKEVLSSLPFEAKREALFFLSSILLDKPRRVANA